MSPTTPLPLALLLAPALLLTAQGLERCEAEGTPTPGPTPLNGCPILPAARLHPREAAP